MKIKFISSVKALEGVIITPSRWNKLSDRLVGFKTSIRFCVNGVNVQCIYFAIRGDIIVNLI